MLNLLLNRYPLWVKMTALVLSLQQSKLEFSTALPTKRIPERWFPFRKNYLLVNH